PHSARLALRAPMSEARAARPPVPSFPARRSSDLHQRGDLPAQCVDLGLQPCAHLVQRQPGVVRVEGVGRLRELGLAVVARGEDEDRKSTRLNSSHVQSSYAVFCLQKTIFTCDTPL